MLSGALQAQVNVVRNAPWEKKNFLETFGGARRNNQSCSSLGIGWAETAALAFPYRSWSQGEAWDQCFGDDVGANQTKAGASLGCWRYVGDKVGHVEGLLLGSAHGLAQLQEADSAAVSMGYVAYKSSSGEEAVVKIDEASAETELRVIGEIRVQIALLGISVFVMTGRSLGYYPDTDSRNVEEHHCGSQWDYKTETYSYSKIWANGLPFSEAKANCNHNAILRGTVVLSELLPEECP
ncbi:MAG: hypothetical protein DWQ01_18535 [Planctomycetota bacterium]|nr:MAG: hypothetical protein DWQ01_18535 [Planctomycetota bacterium]